MGTFRIEASNFHWIRGDADDPKDLCLHGRVKLQLGETVIEDLGTVSATALYLLKTLTEDKLMSYNDIQMVPCCGHFLIANNDLTSVTIIGCDKGMDWSTVHTENGVKIILPSGQEEEIEMESYKAEVYAFADSVEAYYNTCSPKELPNDDFRINGYVAFWNEWHRRRKA